MANINAKELRNLPIIIPKKDLQRKFCEYIEDVETLRNKWELGTKAIEQIFDTLLHRAFTGELTAKWREAHLKELLVEMENQAKALESN